MKKIAAALLFIMLFSACGRPQDLGLVTAGKNLEIRIPCRSASWAAVTTYEQKGLKTTTRSGIYYREGRFRLEILDAAGENRQIILFDNKELHVLNHDNTAMRYDMNNREAEIFLRKVFVNTGAARKPETRGEDGLYAGKKCAVYEYEIFRNHNGLYAKAKVREWRNRKGATVKMETISDRSEFEFGGRKVEIGPVTETYETSNYRCNPRLMGMLFEIPFGVKVRDYGADYSEKLKKAGKAASAEQVSFTVKPR